MDFKIWMSVAIDILIIAGFIQLAFKVYGIFFNSILWMWRLEEDDRYNFVTIL